MKQQKYTLVIINTYCMKYWLLLLAVPVLTAGDCGSKEDKKPGTPGTDTTAVPACVQKLIDDASKEDPPMTPMRVDEYSYKGKKVYLVTSPCCDFYNFVYDENCKQLCAPSGGFTGGGDGKCRDFDSTAKKVKEIWRYQGK